MPLTVVLQFLVWYPFLVMALHVKDFLAPCHIVDIPNDSSMYVWVLMCMFVIRGIF